MTLNKSISGKYIMHRLIFLGSDQHTKFEMRSVTDFKDNIGAKFQKGLRDSEHAH